MKTQDVESPRLTAREVAKILRLHIVTLYRHEKLVQGFPKKYHDGRRHVYWLKDEVMAYAAGGSDKVSEAGKQDA